MDSYKFKVDEISWRLGTGQGLDWTPGRVSLRGYLIDQFGADNISVWPSGSGRYNVYVRDGEVATLFRVLMQSYIVPVFRPYQTPGEPVYEVIPQRVFLKRLSGKPG